MEPTGESTSATFLRSMDEWIERLRRDEGPSGDGAAPPRRVVNLAHRLSDTLPSDLADRLEAFADEFWAVCQASWPDRSDEAAERPTVERLDRLEATWERLRRDLEKD